MNANVKGILATVVLVACIATIAVLALKHVEGAAIAAAAVVTTLVTYYTRDARSGDSSTDTKKPGGDGGVLLPLIASGAIVASWLAGCGGALEQTLAEKTYKEEQLDCADQYETRLLIDQCRDRVRERWGIKSLRAKDAGQEAGPPQPDGGK